MGVRAWLNASIVATLMNLAAQVHGGTSHGYDSSVAYALMELNTAALCRPALVANWTCARCKAGVFADPARDVDVVLAQNDQLLGVVGTDHARGWVIVVIRGTVDSSIPDWILDFEAWETPFNNSNWAAGAKVHAGFYHAWAELRPAMMAKLAARVAANPTYATMVSGHSLGASMATLLVAEMLGAADRNNLKQHPVGVAAVGTRLYTFGEPRTGNQAFADGFVNETNGKRIEVHRVVNKHDIVPHLAPKDWKGLDYHHISPEVWLAPNGTTIFCCDTCGEDPACSDSLPLTSWSGADHTSYFGLDAGPCSSR